MDGVDTITIWRSVALWFGEFLHFLPQIFPRFAAAWFLCLLFLIYAFRTLKPRLQSRIVRFDETLQLFARRLRYRLQQADAALEPNKPPTERVLLTWFFRFWTNFASAPSLSVISIGMAIWMFHRARISFILSSFITPFYFTEKWLLPVLCYFGSMGLSYVLKRVFRRVRPVREKGAFGHRLKDGSFPSGHSLTAFCFWIMCALVVSTPLFALVAIAIVLLTGLSRIYMAVHWPSDVVGGYVIGAVWTAFCFVALRGVL
jgi:membrane-associated phospholipid phosphatase